jgi:hypothetical protein
MEAPMAAQQPTYQAYTVVKREGQDDYWLNIGAAFMHQDGDDFNIMLQALPINGKIVLRPPKSDTKEDTTQGAQQTVREANVRRERKARNSIYQGQHGREACYQ